MELVRVPDAVVRRAMYTPLGARMLCDRVRPSQRTSWGPDLIPSPR